MQSGLNQAAIALETETVPAALIYLHAADVHRRIRRFQIEESGVQTIKYLHRIDRAAAPIAGYPFSVGTGNCGCTQGCGSEMKSARIQRAGFVDSATGRQQITGRRQI
jgi:hypothetical protein